MNNLIITDEQTLKKLLTEIISEHVKINTDDDSYSETITINDAIEFLKKKGYPTSKAKIYKLTSNNKIPHKLYGNKLVFNKKELLEWAINSSK